MKIALLLTLPALACASLSVAQADDQAKADTRWKSTASAGLTLQKGNSDTLVATAQFLTEKKWLMNEISLGVNGTYGEDHGNQNAGSAGAFGQYNRLFSERFFAYGRVDATHDSIADIDYRVSLSPGVGYYFIKDKKMSLSGEAGPGLVFEKLGGIERNYWTLRFAEKFDYQINERAKLWESLEFLPQVDDFGDFVVNAEVGIDTKITEAFSLRTYVVDVYRSEPAVGRKNNDVKLVAAVGYTF